jgi:hypothetical protein
MNTLLPYASGTAIEHYDALAKLVEHFKGLPAGKFTYRHHVSDDIYVRELRLAKGTAMIGAIHANETTLVVTKGRLHLYTLEGLRLAKSGDIIVSPPGTQRAAVALEDCSLVTFHNTRGRPLKEVLADLVVKDLKEVQRLSAGDCFLYVNGERIPYEEDKYIS